MGEQWPTDTEWRKFAARIADGVTLHLANGGKIAVFPERDECRCPLGTALESWRFPSAFLVAEKFGVSESVARGFINGFEDRQRDSFYEGPGDDAAFRLGRAYRRRFIEKEST